MLGVYEALFSAPGFVCQAITDPADWLPLRSLLPLRGCVTEKALVVTTTTHKSSAIYVPSLHLWTMSIFVWNYVYNYSKQSVIYMRNSIIKSNIAFNFCPADLIEWSISIFCASYRSSKIFYQQTKCVIFSEGQAKFQLWSWALSEKWQFWCLWRGGTKRDLSSYRRRGGCWPTGHKACNPAVRQNPGGRKTTAWNFNFGKWTAFLLFLLNLPKQVLISPFVLFLYSEEIK